MDATPIHDLVARVLTEHRRHRLAPRTAARQVSGGRPVAAMPMWRRPPAAVAALALFTGAAMASVGITSHVDVSPPRSASAPASLDTASHDLAVIPLLSAIPSRARPHIRPVLSDEVRLAALEQGKRLRSMEPGAVMPPAPVTRTFELALAKTSATPKVPADGAAVYALVTDVTHTRIASELRQQLMGSSATVGDLPGAPRTELMQVSAGWRAVVWPFATESAADKARRMLAERGIRTELLKF